MKRPELEYQEMFDEFALSLEDTDAKLSDIKKLIVLTCDKILKNIKLTELVKIEGKGICTASFYWNKVREFAE